MASCSGTSFQRKIRSQRVPGTRPSLRNGQLLLSTGVPSLDYIIGGGLAVGTLLLIEEDSYESYSRMLLKYFLAEGIVSGHSLFIASAKDHPEEILQELPAPLLDDVIETNETIRETENNSENSNSSTAVSQNSMTIAWRYQNLPKVQTALTSSSRFGHYYNVSKTMSTELQQSVKFHGFFLPDEVPLDLAVTDCGNMNFGYVKLLRSIQRVIREEGFDGVCPQIKQRNILRIGIHSLGSLLWGEDIDVHENPKHACGLTKFLYALRGLLRTSLSACVITVPAYLIQNKAIMDRVVKLSDTVIGLESFNVSERESNPLYKDYHETAFASRLVRHSEPIKQTESGRISQTAEHRMWWCSQRQGAPGLLVTFI
ncbi:elongator complex protein 4 isoform X2 [Chiloscyllium punctatum]|uniref:elongator complex protein 4 isoform X2 n=1 Tax=Chiloscyllium punctatum TaxID=137246 RepID=UPI003B63FEBB